MKPERRCGETRGFIYLSFLFRPVGFCFSKILHLCRNPPSQNPPVLLPQKSVCWHTLPCCRVRRQPLSRVSRKQRYNTLDFASKIVCQQGCSRPYWKPCVKGDSPPLNTPYFLRCEYPSCKNTVWNTCSENAKEAVLSHNTCVVELHSFIELQHQTGSAKPVQYLHSCRLIVAQFLEGKLPDLG